MMDKVLLSITAASVLCLVFSHAERQYHFIYDPKNMTEALKYCREKYTDLATIKNKEDVKILENMVDGSKIKSKTKPAWIGLYDDINSWRWSLANRSFYQDGKTEFRKWANGEPNNKYNEYCVGIVRQGQWNDYACTKSLKAICFDARGSNETFAVINKAMTWTEAQRHCRAHYTDLAIVRNEAENQKIKELVPVQQAAWIGLFRDSWRWSDGSNSSFRYWKNREPNNVNKNKICVVADFSQYGEWEDWRCDLKRAFICYSRVSKSMQVMKVRLTKKDSSLDLNDPAVMEDLLEKLKQNLRDRGVTGDIQLRWKKQSDGKVFHKEKNDPKKKKPRTKRDEL